MSMQRTAPCCLTLLSLASASLSLGAICPMPAEAGVPRQDGNKKIDATLKGLKTLIQNAIGNDDISVDVEVLAEQKYVVTLSGTVETEEDADAALYATKQVLLNLSIMGVTPQSKIEVKPKPPAPQPVRFMWPLTHLLEEKGFDKADTISNLAKAVNAIFPAKKDAPPLLTVQNDTLWIYGTLQQVQSARAFLALIDAPVSEVKAEIWAIQLSGTEQSVAERYRKINDDVRNTQQKVLAVQAYIAHKLHLNAATDTKTDKLFKAFYDAGFGGSTTDPSGVQPIDRALSLVECFIHLGLSRKRSEIINALADNFGTELGYEEAWKYLPGDDGKIGTYKPFRYLRALLCNKFSSLVEADRESAKQFLHDVVDYGIFVDTLGLYGTPSSGKPGPVVVAAGDTPKKNPYAPEALARDSTTMDRLLLNIVQAYQKDMEEMYFLPLLDRAQGNTPGSSSGIGLAGRVEVVVSSRRPASVVPSVETYLERATVNELNADTLLQIFGLKGGSSGAGDSKAAGSANGNKSSGSSDSLMQLIGNLTQPQKALLIAALNPPYNSTYHQLSPGVSINLTPAVAPDANSADVVLNAQFGVETHIKDKDNGDGLHFRPPDAVKSHTVNTVFNLSGFNIAQVSSFNLETVYPRPPFVTPILGQIPLVGPMFRFGRGSGHTYHQSVILMNATLIPRSLQLMGFYGANFGGQKARDIASTDEKSPKQGTKIYLNIQ